MDFLPLIQKSQEIRDNTFKPVLNTIKRFIKAAISSRKMKYTTLFLIILQVNLHIIVRGNCRMV